MNFTQTGALVVESAFSELLSLSLDFFVIFGIAVLFFVYTLYTGKKKSIATLLSLHITALFFLIFPYSELFAENVDFSQIFIVKGLLFLSVWIAVRMILLKMIYGSWSDHKVRKISEAFLMSVVLTGTFFVYVSFILSFSEFYTITPPLDSLFALLFEHSSAPFWWGVSSLGVLFFLLKTKKIVNI